MAKVVVLRMGHRINRDKRVTTHVGLVARAFGADGMIIANVSDASVETSIRKVVKNWGGEFFVESGRPWKTVVEDWRRKGGMVVHLTMYGLPVDEMIDRLRGREILVIVGGEKMPGEIFKIADFNVSVGNQPHSEIAALAIFLDRLFYGSELKKEFKNGKMRIIPTEKGKKVEIRT
ncbi:MAG: tRNA (cytidine(56)-2'-O)-methyltransferase [Candidatus Hadarchaeum sp.]|uniref:tRNA (cytidine(56)-2'-O)-methyltransferase n=1 Tax=Candidatus Hadarchaeum sp. TaxID=2883567 RepID=UPI003D114B8B